MNRPRSRGASLAATLLLAALALTLAMTLAGVGVAHVNLSVAEENRMRALAGAEAVLSRGIERLLARKGEYFQGDPLDLEVSLDGGDCTGQLTFDPDRAREWGLPVSTHNLFSESTASGAEGRTVPAQSAHLVGRGTCRGVERTVEAILVIPVYKYALSSAGPLSSSGEMVVAGAAEPGDVLPSVKARLEDLLPGHIASNYSGGEQDSISLNGATKPITITGDARAAGSIHRQGRVDVRGATRPDSGQIDMPRLDLADFDPAKFGSPVGLNPDLLGPDQVLPVNGLVKYRGDVHVKKMNLATKERGAILWVDGDITVDEGIEGVGAIFATGNVTIRGAGGPQVTSSNVVAVAAGGDMTIEGNGQDASFFQGVLFSGGNMQLSNVSALGSVLVGGAELNGEATGPADPSLTLTEANLVHVSDTVRFDFDMPFGMGAGGAAGTGAPGAPKFAAGRDTRGDPLLKLDLRLREGVELEDYYVQATDRYDKNRFQGDGFSPDSHFAYYDTVEGKFLSRSEYKARLQHMADQYGILDENGPGPDDDATYATWDEYCQANGYRDLDHVIDLGIQAAREAKQEEIARIDAWYQERKTQPNDTGSFTLDPNEFVQWESRTRIALWREWRKP